MILITAISIAHQHNNEKWKDYRKVAELSFLLIAFSECSLYRRLIITNSPSR